MKEDVRLDEQGFPVSKEINRIMDVIEKTPKNKFIFKNSSGEGGSDYLYLRDTSMTSKQKMKIFEKNPKAMFSYGRGGVRSSVFTNFVFSDDGKKIYYDIIRLVPFNDDVRYDDDELVKVDKFDRHSGLEVEKVGLSNWYYIDFIKTSISFLNWKTNIWEDLK
tara:strand:+ start:278 stop:766 length:489 start_codon:yes stop_codon:yes gene_type:complete